VPLTRIQSNVLDHMQHLSVKKHYNNLRTIKDRIKTFNLSDSDLFKMGKFIEEEAPIIIHFNFQKAIESFLKDDYYRSCFEIGSSGGLNNR
jgi:hypothetical protein